MRLQFDHQEGRCCWCLDQMDMTKSNRGENPKAATWEHLVPQCMGGSHDLINLVLACRRCNCRRGSQIKLVPQYRSYTLDAVTENASK